MQAVKEERIETMCEQSKVRSVVKSVKKVHSYEEVSFDAYALLDSKDF